MQAQLVFFLAYDPPSNIYKETLLAIGVWIRTQSITALYVTSWLPSEQEER